MEKSPPTHTLDSFPAAAIRFVRALERNQETIATRHGLSASELRALFRVADQGSVRPKELAAHMEMTTGGITAISHRLVQLHFLERIAHPEDRRSLYLRLTPTGHDIMKLMHSDFTGMIAEATSMLNAEQLEAFESALSAVAEEVSVLTGR